MKVSVSLPEEDVATLDDYVRRTGLPSRSAGLQRAIRMLSYPQLEDDYREAWSQWSAGEDAVVWETAAGDGLGDATR